VKVFVVQEDYKWSTSCCSSGLPPPNDFPSTHLSYGGGPGGGGEEVYHQQQHHHHHQYHEGSSGGTLKRGQQINMSIPDCVQPVPNAVFNLQPDYNNSFDPTPIRLYMNQTAGNSYIYRDHTHTLYTSGEEEGSE
jgi:hypothetical protein